MIHNSRFQYLNHMCDNPQPLITPYVSFGKSHSCTVICQCHPSSWDLLKAKTSTEIGIPLFTPLYLVLMLILFSINAVHFFVYSLTCPSGDTERKSFPCLSEINHLLTWRQKYGVKEYIRLRQFLLSSLRISGETQKSRR